MNAALSAPADVPTRRSGSILRAARAWSIPTWTAPRLPPPDNTNAVVISGAALVGGCEPGEGHRPDQQPEVAQGDVVEVGLNEEVHDDAGQPGGDQIAAEPGTEGDDQSRHDLDDAHRQHRLVGVARDEVIDLRCKVDRPVDEQIEELVEAEHDRRHDEASTEEPERLEGRVVPAGRLDRRDGGLRGEDGHVPLSFYK